MSAEIGGLNAVEPLCVAALMDLPVIDCDGMGRAFPELQVCLQYKRRYKITYMPAVIKIYSCEKCYRKPEI